MKQILIGFLCGLGLFPPMLHGQEVKEPPPVYTVVKIIDIDGGAVTFTVVQAEELKLLLKTVEEEKKAMPIAYNALRKAWRDKHKPPVKQGQQPKKIKVPPFPLRQMPAPRELKKIGVYTNTEVATKCKLELEGRETERVAKIKTGEESPQSRDAMAMNLPAGFSNPNAPMAVPNATAGDIDPEERQEMLTALVEKIKDVIVAGFTDGSRPDKPSTGSAGKVKRLGEDGTTPLVDRPTELVKPSR